MTANRFDYTAYDDGTESIYDRKKDEYYFDMQLSEIEELMNELAEENEQLRNNIKEVKAYNNWLVAVLEDTGAIVEIKKSDVE